jgi:hypothetical protein
MDHSKSQSSNYQQLLLHANVNLYPKTTEQLYYARLANAADKFEESL